FDEMLKQRAKLLAQTWQRQLARIVMRPEQGEAFERRHEERGPSSGTGAAETRVRGEERGDDLAPVVLVEGAHRLRDRAVVGGELPEGGRGVAVVGGDRGRGGGDRLGAALAFRESGGAGALARTATLHGRARRGGAFHARNACTDSAATYDHAMMVSDGST